MAHKSILLFRSVLSFLLLTTMYWHSRGVVADQHIYRCYLGGMVEFRQAGCPLGDESVVQVIEGSAGVAPSKPGLRLKRLSKTAASEQHKPLDRGSDKGCWRRRQQLQRIERKLRTGYKASQYQRLHDRQEEHESYLRRFCR